MLVAEKMENGCGFHRTRWSAIGTIRMAAIIYAPRRRRRITRRIQSIASRLVQELRRGGKGPRPTIPAARHRDNPDGRNHLCPPPPTAHYPPDTVYCFALGSGT